MSDIDRYARQRQIQLAQQVRARKKVYLDTRFWIHLRDAAQGTSSDPKIVQLLSLLRDGVAQERLFCPISESTFLEVLKQAPTADRRMATASIIDQLSDGLSLVPEQVRVGTELAHFFWRKSGAALYDLQELVWTKLSYTLGYLHPAHDGLDAETQYAIQSSAFDTMWTVPLTRIVSQLPPDIFQERSGFQNLAAQLDNDIQAHQVNLVSYRQTYKDEVAGALDAAKNLLWDVLDGMAEKAGRSLPPPGTPEIEASIADAKAACLASLDTGTEPIVLRTIHALASLHAGLRWNRRTHFVGNHLYDFSHAAGAVSYCDAFLTEGFLAHLINANHVGLARVNPCRTTSDVGEAVAIVREMASGPVD